MKLLDTKKKKNNRMVVGALFDFMAYLTTRKGVIHIGSSEEVSPILDAFKEWCADRKLNPNDADVKNWESKI
jgi:hypothetical protein